MLEALVLEAELEALVLEAELEALEVVAVLEALVVVLEGEEVALELDSLVLEDSLVLDSVEEDSLVEDSLVLEDLVLEWLPLTARTEPSEELDSSWVKVPFNLRPVPSLEPRMCLSSVIATESARPSLLVKT